MEYAILMPHGVGLLQCLERVRSAQNTEESTSCTLSTKIEPDTRGLDPAIHLLRETLAKSDGCPGHPSTLKLRRVLGAGPPKPWRRRKPGHDECACVSVNFKQP